MRVKSLKPSVRLLLFVVLLGASSTAYADTLTITSFGISNLPVFSLQVERLLPRSGPNQQILIEGMNQISQTIRLQAGTENSVFIVLTTGSFVESEVPEPATIVLLVSGLGFMSGVLKKKTKPLSVNLKDVSALEFVTRQFYRHGAS